MTELLPKFLQYISTTNGFLTFVSIITVGYAGIWFLFLFEPSVKLAREAQPNPQGQDEKSKKGAKGEQKQAPKKGSREPAAGKA